MVVTSRTADYDSLAERLRVQGAVAVRPLTREQVTAYLADLGPTADTIRATLHEDPSLWEQLESPLMLYVVTLAFGSQSTLPLAVGGSPAERRARVFQAYVEQMLLRRVAIDRYLSEQTVHWLSWLAVQMVAHGQTVFYLEELQFDWLPERLRLPIRMTSGLAVGLANGLSYGLLVGILAGMVAGPVAGWVLGPATGLIAAWRIGSKSTSNTEIDRVEVLRWSWPGIGPSFLSFLPRGLVIVSLISLLDGLAHGLSSGLFFGLSLGLAAAPVWWLISGVKFDEIETRVAPNEGIHRSARSACLVVMFTWLVCVISVCVLRHNRPFQVIWLLCFLAGGLCLGLPLGGDACLKHYVLRVWLIRNGSTPWNYVKFLDYAADRILLRKVGGGYMFIHRMLLEWFAARYVEHGASRDARGTGV